MAIDFSKWLGNVRDELAAVPSQTEAERAVRAWQKILDKPSSIVFRTPSGTVLAAQTVRLESDNSASLAESAAGSAPVRKIVLFGVKNHPTVDDADMGEGYRFVSGGDEYQVVDVIETLGEVQGIAEAVG